MKFILMSLIVIFTIPLETNHEGKKSAWYVYSEQVKYTGRDKSKKDRIFLEVKDNNLKGELINFTKKTKKIITEDGSLIMIMEAFHNDSWDPVEYWLWSDCGNSYFNPLELNENHKVDFALPVFDGEIKTKMRLKLYIEDDEILYSDEFIGSVNKEKFLPLENLPYPDLDESDIYLDKNRNFNF